LHFLINLALNSLNIYNEFNGLDRGEGIMNDKNCKLGLALGSGGARGLAHIGFLEVMEEENIKIDFISGSSMGSLIGGLYASGVSLRYIKGLAEELDWEHLSDLTFPKKGLLKGEKLLTFLEILSKKKDISDLNIPFSAVACDIERGEHIVLDSGSIAEAIRASTAIPGVYIPYEYQGRQLVDGGIIDPVPVKTCYDMGADIVIGVDVSIKDINTPVNNIFDVLLNTFDIMQLNFTVNYDFNADLFIQPQLGNLSAFNLDKTDFCIKAGRRAAEDNLEKIKKIIEKGKDIKDEQQNTIK